MATVPRRERGLKCWRLKILTENAFEHSGFWVVSQECESITCWHLAVRGQIGLTALQLPIEHRCQHEQRQLSRTPGTLIVRGCPALASGDGAMGPTPRPKRWRPRPSDRAVSPCPELRLDSNPLRHEGQSPGCSSLTTLYVHLRALRRPCHHHHNFLPPFLPPLLPPPAGSTGRFRLAGLTAATAPS